MPLLSPKVRSDLEFFDQEVEGKPIVLVRDPVRGIYLKFNPLQGAMLRALDGARSLPELVEALCVQFETEIPLPAVERFLDQARREILLDIASYDHVPEAVTRRARRELERAGYRFHALGDDPPSVTSAEAALFVLGTRRLQAGDPARALDYFHAVLQLNPTDERAKTLATAIQTAYVRALAGSSMDWPAFPLFDPTRILGALDRTIGKLVFHRWSWLLLVGLVSVALYCHFTTAYPEFNFRYSDVIIAYLIMMLHGLCHELGHGLACYHYGGAVREVGVMLFYYVSVNPYCDTSSTYLFEDRRHKLIVQGAGAIATAVFACVMVVVMAVIRPDLFFYQSLEIALVVVLLSLLGSVIPLMKLDAYYALCDHLGIPNLRERSFRYLRSTLGIRLLGLDLEREPVTSLRGALYLWFAALSLLFTIWFVVFSVNELVVPIVERLRGPGLILSIVLFAYALRGWLFRPLARFVVLAIRERRRIFTARRTAVLIAISTAMIAPWFVHGPVVVDSDFVLVPKTRAEARADAAGSVQQVLVREGDVVTRGQPLAILRDGARARLEIRSPIAGVVVTKHLEDRLHSRLERGASFAEIHDVTAFTAELHLPASTPLAELRPGDPIRLRAVGDPDREIECRLAATRLSGELVVTTTPFEMPVGRAGMGGHSRIYGRERSLAYAKLYLPIQRILEVELWSMF